MDAAKKELPLTDLQSNIEKAGDTLGDLMARTDTSDACFNEVCEVSMLN